MTNEELRELDEADRREREALLLLSNDLCALQDRLDHVIRRHQQARTWQAPLRRVAGELAELARTARAIAAEAGGQCR